MLGHSTTHPSTAASPTILTSENLKTHLLIALFQQDDDLQELWFLPAIVGGWQRRIALAHLPLTADPVPNVLTPLVLYALGYDEADR